MAKIDMLYECHTYDADKPLFRKLGLIPFRFDIRETRDLEVGTVHPENGGTIKIMVHGMPAQFWEFDILTSEGKHFTVSTGSGCLRDFWDAVRLIADGMLVVKETEQ